MLLRKRVAPTIESESNQELPNSKKAKQETGIVPKKPALNETTKNAASPTKPVILTPPRTSEESDIGSDSDASEGSPKAELNYLDRLNHNKADSAHQLLDYALTPYNPKSRSVLPYLFASTPDYSDDSDSEENSPSNPSLSDSENQSPNLSLSGSVPLPLVKGGPAPH